VISPDARRSRQAQRGARCCSNRSLIAKGTASTLVLLLLGLPAAAQDPGPKGDYLKNTELCNGAGRTSPEVRIEGCTALIRTVQGAATALPIAYNNRGNAYVAKGDYDHAIQDFDQSIKLNQTYIKPLNNRGVAYLRKGEYDIAIGAFDDAIRLKPDYGEAFANRAEAYLKKKEYDRAARDFDEAIRIDPGLKAAWNGRCWAGQRRSIRFPRPDPSQDGAARLGHRRLQFRTAPQSEAGECALWPRIRQAQEWRQGGQRQ
jgi:tetratricopeptide (TPR) repeat protein